MLLQHMLPNKLYNLSSIINASVFFLCNCLHFGNAPCLKYSNSDLLLMLQQCLDDLQRAKCHLYIL